MANIIKTLKLHRHTDKDDTGRHISYKGAGLANDVGRVYGHVHHLFFGPLIRTTETALAMATFNRSFEEVRIHDAIDGLGSDDLFRAMVTDAVKKAIKVDGMSNLEGVKTNHGSDTLVGFINDGVHAIRLMFGLMDKDQLGVGIFHDPTIPLVAESLGLEDARSLDSMESVTFRLYDDDTIIASWD